jgi:hypothetical protein
MNQMQQFRGGIMTIHNFYSILTAKEKEFVDQMFSRQMYKIGKEKLGHPLRGDDSVEHAVEAVARWVVESRNAGS